MLISSRGCVEAVWGIFKGVFRLIKQLAGHCDMQVDHAVALVYNFAGPEKLHEDLSVSDWSYKHRLKVPELPIPLNHLS